MKIDVNNQDAVIKTLMEADEAYFNDSTPIMSDEDYDKLRRLASKLYSNNSYFKKVGSTVRGGKIPLPHTMGGLDQIHEETFHTYKPKLAGKVGVISEKLDGVSCLVEYRDGKFSTAYSRGNGVEGADISRNFVALKNFLPEIDTVLPYVAIRGEIIMDKVTFAEKYSGTYKTARNMVAGAMNRKEPSPSLADTHFIAYEWVQSPPGMTKCETLSCMEQLGFDIAKNELLDFNTIPPTELTFDLLTALIKRYKLCSTYELDGIVLSLNNFADELDSNSSSINPTHSFKIKAPDEDEIVVTSVLDVEWTLSKSGFIKPVVKILPVQLYGTTVSNATGFNAKFINTHRIGTGAKVKITKSGSVIPYILEVVHPAPETSVPNQFQYHLNESGVEYVVDDAENNSQVIFKRILSFCDSIGIDLLKEASLKSFIEYNFGNDDFSFEEVVVELFEGSESSFTKPLGVNGSKIFSKIDQISRKLPYYKFLGGLPYFGVGFGVRKAKMLLSGCGGMAKFSELAVADIEAIDGFDTITAEYIVNGIYDALNLLEALTVAGVSFVESIIDEDLVIDTLDLSNASVVFTGFRDKALEALIESNGGKVASGVSKKTTHVLAMVRDSGSSKIKKAMDLGIPIMTPEEFKQEIFGNEG